MTLGGEVCGARHGRGSIGAQFEVRPNALNFLRLCLALEVIVWHAYSLRGETWLPTRAEHFLADIGVDSFFAISGFLVCRSWVRRPSARSYLTARARRILPGLWACLAVTAFLLAPAASRIAGTTAPTLQAQAKYVLANAGVWMTQPGIGGGPTGVPHPGAWDGSLWSLGYEAACYIVLALLGTTRLLRPAIVAVVAVSVWMVACTASLVGVPLVDASGLVPCTLRITLMFCCGMLLFLHRDKVPSSAALAVLAAVLLGAGAILTPDYRVVAAPAIAYLCIYGALYLGRHARLRLRSDLSYGTYVYAFPIQQAMLACGVTLGWFGFTSVTVIATLPVAALSWHLVERPVLRSRAVPAAALAVGVTQPAAQ
jgi:peptidoglycan/LPS O-acetylase OafA/YrhL